MALSWAPTHVGVYVRNWSPYHALKARVRNFRFYPYEGVPHQITSSSVSGPHVNLTSALEGYWSVTVPENLKIPLGGVITPAEILKRVYEAGYHIRYEYAYDDDPNPHVKRKLYIETPSDEIRGVLRLGENITNLDYSYTNMKSYLGAFPIVKIAEPAPKKYDAIRRFQQWSTTKNAQIPSKVEENEESGTITEYTKLPAPYAKSSGSYNVVAEETGAEYAKRKMRQADGTTLEQPRYLGVEMDADHPLNMYWKLADELTKANTGSVNLEVEYARLDAPWGELQVGDRFILVLPGREEGMEILIHETEKRTHEPNIVKIKSDIIGFVKKMIKR